MLVIRYHFFSFLVYIIVFVGLTVVLTSMTSEQIDANFSAIRPSFTIVNRDTQSPLVDGLATFMRENGVEVELEDNRSTLQDATFYHATDIILIIPQGFHESFMRGDPVAIETVKTTQIARGFLGESMVSQYLNLVRVYMLAGGEFNEQAVVSAVLHDLHQEAVVEKVQFGIGAPIDTGFKMYFQMFNFSIIIISFLFVTLISMIFRRSDLRMRNLCAPLNPRSQSVQQTLASAIMSTVTWALLVAIGFIMNGANIGGVDSRIIALIVLNSFLVMIYAMALAALAGSFINSSNVQSAVANILTLGLCFLGGVFVPLSLLGDGILAVARFLPTYWNVIALERISELTSFDAGALAPVWQAMVMQLAFAAAIFCVALVVGKYVNQSERFRNTVRTELEA